MILLQGFSTRGADFMCYLEVETEAKMAISL